MILGGESFNSNDGGLTGTTSVDHEVRLAQLVATQPKRSLEIAKSLVRKKLDGCISNVSLFG